MSHPISELPALKPPRKSRRWWWLGIVLSVVLLLLVGAAGVYWFVISSAHRQLQAVMTELDESDPNWRLPDIIAERPELPDEENAALVVISAVAKMPANWGSKLHIDVFPDELPPPVQLNEVQIVELRKELQTAQPALEEARTLIDYTEGRYPIRYAPDWISTLLPDIQNARQIAFLLECDAKLLAQEGKMEEAWQSSQAIYHAGMSLGNGDMLIIMLVRVAIRAVAVSSMERVLAQGEVKAESLKTAQELLEKDVQEPILLMALRGERAGQHQLFSAIEDGTVNLGQLTAGQLPPGLEDLIAIVNVGMVQRSHIWILKHSTQMIENIKEMDDETLRQETNRDGLEMEAAFKKKQIPTLAGLLLPATNKMVEADIRVRTHMQCAICALAAERYRLEHQRWPDSLETLVNEGLITKVPVDPYDGQPLRFKRTKNGIIVYSIGQDQDNKGASLDNPDLEEPRVRIEFRVWNPDRRRQPAREK